MAKQEEYIRVGQTQREGAREEPRMRWWREARFGMFIHWGLYALPAGTWQERETPHLGEWIMHDLQIPVAEYQQLAAQFNPAQFDAAEWVSLAKRAGMKWMVITSKHHDGFCLFDSKLTDYDTVDATPFHRDVVKELADECARQGIRFGFYYSQTQDWHHPGGDGNGWDFDEETKDFDGYVEDYVKGQLRELLTNYGPIAVIWFDTPRRIKPEQSRELLELVHELQPDCICDGRLGNGMGDYAVAGDNFIPAEHVDADWETPATINDTWGYKANDDNWKSAEDLVRKLVDIASKGGNYLLNVGPTGEGVIPQPSVERLLEVGEWLQANGESIYGTGAGPLQGLGWCRTTAKRGRVYLHVFDWPAGGRIALPASVGKVARAYLLAGGAPLPLRADANGITLQGPPAMPDAKDTVVALVIEGWR